MEKEKWIEGLIGLLAIISIVLIAIESLVSLSPGWLLRIYVVDLVICLVFAWEFAYRLRYAEDRFAFLKSHGFEILAMIPVFALYAAGSVPAISAGLRSLRLIRVARAMFIVTRISRFFGLSGRFIQRSRLVYFFIASISIIFIGGFVAFLLESGTPGAQINNFSDALWWSISTVTTVGYGDIVPNTISGRVMGMILMVIGIGIMTAFISQVSATLVESRLKRGHDDKDLKQTVISEIKDRIDHINELSSDEVNLLTEMLRSLANVKNS